MIVHDIKSFINQTNSKTEQIFSGKFGKLKLTLLAIFLSLFFAFPSYDVVFKGEFDENWNAFISQSQNPFVKRDYPTSSHASSITLRLTPAVIGKILGLNRVGFLWLQFFSLALLFHCLTNCFYDISEDIVTTSYLTIAAAFIFIGNVLVSDVRGIFDVIAFAFLAFTMSQKNPLIIFASTFLASFTDERAFLASGLIVIYFVIKEKENASLTEFFRGNSRSWAVILSGVFFLSTRLLLARTIGLETTVSNIGIPLAIKQINAWAFGLWTGLEGFWLLVFIAALIGIRGKNYPLIFLTLIVSGIICFGAVTVHDITRSMAYVFPLAILALCLIKQAESLKMLQYFSFATMIICFAPSYYIGGANTVMVFYPLILQILRWLNS